MRGDKTKGQKAPAPKGANKGRTLRPDDQPLPGPELIAAAQAARREAARRAAAAAAQAAQAEVRAA